MTPRELANTSEERAKVADLRTRFNAKMVGTGTPVHIEFRDDGPDSLGRRHFALTWIGEDYVRAGMVRGQHFFGRPEKFVV